MSHKRYAEIDKAIRRELRKKTKPDWVRIRATYPDIPKSSFYHRVKVNARNASQAGAAKKARLADPLRTTGIRRDPFLLIADFDLQAELADIDRLIDRVRSPSLDRRGGIKNPIAFDRSIGLRLKLLKLAPRVVLNSEDMEWPKICRMFAQSMGRSTAVQFSHFRRDILADEEWTAFHLAIGLLKDSKLIDTGPKASVKNLHRAITLRLKATKALVRWQEKLDEIRLVDRQVEWIVREVGKHDDLTPEVWDFLRRFAHLWIHLVGRRCGEGRGQVFSPEVDCVSWLKPRDWKNFPGIRTARAFIHGHTHETTSRQRGNGFENSSASAIH